MALTVGDTQRVVEEVAERRLELGIVGAARRHRGVAFEPFLRDEIVLACPPGHRFAGRTVALDELREEPLIVMQEGAGVRQVVEDELRRAGVRFATSTCGSSSGSRSPCGAPCRPASASRSSPARAVEGELAAGLLTEARVAGLDVSREISLARGAGRSATRAAEAFVAFARERLD